MQGEMLHVFRNTPFGRESFLQSLYTSKLLSYHLRIYIPKVREFLLYFPLTVMTVELDHAFLRDPATAEAHARSLIREAGADASFFVPKQFTAETLPDIPVDFSLMTCPRTLTDLSTKIGLGYLGPKVRQLIQNAEFPVLIPTPVFKAWKQVVVFFGGSHNAGLALRVGRGIARKTGFPLKIATIGEGRSREDYLRDLESYAAREAVETGEVEWLFFEGGKLEHNLYDIPHDALLVIGAYGHGPVKEVVFGSMMERVHTILPNSMVVVGPHYAEP